jgi:hypothetical protein
MNVKSRADVFIGSIGLMLGSAVAVTTIACEKA